MDNVRSEWFYVIEVLDDSDQESFRRKRRQRKIARSKYFISERFIQSN